MSNLSELRKKLLANQEIEKHYYNLLPEFNIITNKDNKIKLKIDYQKIVVLIENTIIHIPLSLPIGYKNEYPLEEKYWKYGTNILLNG